MSPALAAHLRLLATLHVRTHTRPDPSRSDAERLYNSERLKEFKRRRILQMLAEGAPCSKIRAELHVGSAMITKVKRGD